MKKSLPLITFALLCIIESFSQSVGDYRSNADGNWTTLATWQRWNGSAWVAATDYPGQNSGTGNVLIQNGHDITLNVSPANAIGSLTMAPTATGGDDASLNFGTGANYSLTVTGNVSIGDGDVTITPDGTTSRLHSLIIGGGLAITDNNTFDLNNGDDDCNVTFNGTSFTISNTGTLNLNSVTFSNNGTVTISGDINDVAGTMTVNSNCIINPAASITINNGGGTITGSGTLNVTRVGAGDDFINQYDFGTTSLGNMTVNYSGTGAQDISSAVDPYGALETAGSGIKTNSADIVVNGSVTIGTGTTLACAGPGSDDITFGGSWTNNGTFTSSDDLVTFNGTSAQTVGGSSATTFNNFTMNGAGGLTLNNDVNINGVMTFTSGIVTTSSSNILTFNNDATTTGASNSSFVNGPVRKIGNDAFTFPTGKTIGGYHAIGISAPATVTSQFTAEYFQNDPITLGPISGSSSISTLSTCDYWSLSRDVGTSNVNVTLFWNYSVSTQSCAYNPTGSLVCNLNGSTEWDNVTTSSVAGGSTTSSGSVTRNAVATYNFFTIGNGTGDASLPVKFGDIRGYVKGNGVQLDWSVHTEENVTHYEVERSADGRTFTVAGQVAAQKRPGTIDYSFFDAGAAPGNNFYRIKNVDLDGRYSYSVIIRVTVGKSSGIFTVYPNPVSGNHISLQAPELDKGAYMIRIFNNSGQQVYQRSFSHNGGAVNQTIPLPHHMQKGIYSLQLLNGETKLIRNFVLQ